MPKADRATRPAPLRPASGTLRPPSAYRKPVSITVVIPSIGASLSDAESHCSDVPLDGDDASGDDVDEADSCEPGLPFASEQSVCEELGVEPFALPSPAAVSEAHSARSDKPSFLEEALVAKSPRCEFQGASEPDFDKTLRGPVEELQVSKRSSAVKSSPQQELTCEAALDQLLTSRRLSGACSEMTSTLRPSIPPPQKVFSTLRSWRDQASAAVAGGDVKLNLSGMAPGGKQVKDIALWLGTDDKSTELQLCFDNLRDRGALHVGDALRTNRTLRVLHLGGNAIGANGARGLAEALRRNPVLEDLGLFHNKIGVEGAGHVARMLRDNAALRRLDLSWADLGDGGVEQVALALCENSTLLELQLDGNRVSNAGAGHLVPMLQCTTSRLECLGLARNHIGDVGAARLAAALKHNLSLRELNLSENMISSVGTDSLNVAVLDATVPASLCLEKKASVQHSQSVQLSQSVRHSQSVQHLQSVGHLLPQKCPSASASPLEHPVVSARDTDQEPSWQPSLPSDWHRVSACDADLEPSLQWQSPSEWRRVSARDAHQEQSLQCQVPLDWHRVSANDADQQPSMQCHSPSRVSARNADQEPSMQCKSPSAGAASEVRCSLRGQSAGGGPRSRRLAGRGAKAFPAPKGLGTDRYRLRLAGSPLVGGMPRNKTGCWSSASLPSLLLPSSNEASASAFSAELTSRKFFQSWLAHGSTSLTSASTWSKT